MEKRYNNLSEENLYVKANELRLHALTMIFWAQSGHPGGALSATEIITTLYYNVMNHNPDNPDWPERDRFILSKGHAVPILYAALADSGYFPVDDLKTLRHIDSHLQGHPSRVVTPGIEATGSLGHGLSIGCGLAYVAQKIDKRDWNTYVLLGDGELDEGQVWEAAMFASHQKLDQLVAIVDRNKLQFIGPTEEVLALEPLDAKWEAFGWHVEILQNGHDIHALLSAFERIRRIHNKPKILIANTIKGKGISFMENRPEWHGKAPNKQQFDIILNELRG